MATFFQDLLSSLNSQQGGQQSAQLKPSITTPTTPPPAPAPQASGGSNFFQQLLAKVSGVGQDIGKALTADLPKPGYGTPGKMTFTGTTAPDNPLSRFAESAAYGKEGPNLPLTGKLTTPLIQKFFPDYKPGTFNPAQIGVGLLGLTPQTIEDRKRYALIQQTPTKNLSPKDLAFAQKYEDEVMMNMVIGSVGGIETKGRAGIGEQAAKGAEKEVAATVEKATKGVREKITRNALGEPLPWEENAAAKVVKDSIQEAKVVAKDLKTSVETLPDVIDREVTDVKKKANIVDLFRTPDKVLERVGLGDEAKQLKDAYHNYLTELPVEIGKVTAWADRVKGIPNANVNIFRYLDGQKVELSSTEKQVATEIQGYLKNWADRLGLPPEARITNYITHIFPKGLIAKEFDPDIAKIISETVAKSVYDPFVTKRLGKLGYREDTWAALDAYVKRATRKVNLDPALEAISGKAANLDNDTYQFVKQYIDNVNMRPNTIENWIDNAIKSSPVGYRFGARPFNTLSKDTRQLIYRGTLGLNPVSALKNLTQGVNTYARLGEKYTIIGYAKMVAKRYDPAEIAASGIFDKTLIEDRTLTATKRLSKNIDSALFSLFDFAEKMNRIPAYLGAKQQALDRGLAEQAARDYAKQVVGDTQFYYGSIDTPVALQTDLGKTLFQFQSYAIKQTEFLGGMVAKKDVAGLLRYTLASLLIANTVGKAIGMTAADFLPQVRVASSPLFTFLGDVGQLGLSTVGLGGRDQYGNVPSVQSRAKKVGSDIVPFIPGGVELNRIMKSILPSGAKSRTRGGRATRSAR